MREHKIGEEKDEYGNLYLMRGGDYMWKWMLESHFLTLKDGHSLWTPGRSLWPRISASG